MTRPNTIIVVSVLALLIAGGASFLANKYIKEQSGAQNRGVAIVVAATEIPVGCRLTPAHFKLTTWPKEALVRGYQTNVDKMSGRVAVKPMSAGDIVTEAKLLPQTGTAAGGIMTYMVPQGHRAVTVAVNEVAGVAGFITPGSKVDVVLTTPRPGSAAKGENVSKIILQNVPVLASGQGTEQKEGKPVLVPTVTLDLTPEDAEKLIVGGGVNAGSNKGALQLLLRNVVDIAAVQTKGATIVKALNITERLPAAPKHIRARSVRVVKTAAPVLVVKAAPLPPTYTLDIIRGTEKSSRQYTE